MINVEKITEKNQKHNIKKTQLVMSDTRMNQTAS